jgi:Mg-chelatase subunit ChlD
MIDDSERVRRWRLALGGDESDLASERDRRLDRAPALCYDGPGPGAGRGGGRGGLGGSAPRVARWLGDIREFFPSSVVQVMQQDAFHRLGLREMLLEPEFLAAVQPDIHLVADLLSLASIMPEKAKETARQVVGEVVAEVLRRLEQKTVSALRGALNRTERTSRPRPADIDWPRTIRKNLRHFQPELGTIVPERLVGFGRKGRRADLERVVLCVDQSGSMATSVVYASIFASVIASLPSIGTRLVVFDTSVVDLSEHLSDPVEVLFGVQLGGGTDINQALAYCEGLVERPAETHLVLISDLEEGGDAESMLARIAAFQRSGVNLIVLLALNDEGKPSYHEEHAARVAALGIPVFGCTPEQFPDLIATALKRGDVAAWAASQEIAVVRLHSP